MSPFLVHPGETVVGLGVDFALHLTSGETIAALSIDPVAGITVVSTAFSGTVATAKISIAANQTAADPFVIYTVTGTLGSVRKAGRSLAIRPVA